MPDLPEFSPLPDAIATNTDTPLAVGGEIWLRRGDATLGGARRIALLDAIERTGSITAAAREVGLSYKAAWDAIDAMNNLAGEPLVLRTTGGKGGGGSILSARARQLVETFAAMEREHRRFIERMASMVENFESDRALLQRISMRTSARNTLFGVVDTLVRGAVNDEVTLRLPSGQRITAVITHESADGLDLAPGAEAYALIKASSIIVATGDTDTAPYRLSARNQLSGTVDQIRRGAVNGEISIGVGSGLTLTATITLDSIDHLALEVGKPATALFKASSVIIGVSD